MATKLGLYNQELTEFLGERKLSALTDSRSARRKLDTVYDNDFIDSILESGQWNFAMRTVLIDYDPSFSPDFGYQYVFDKPSDWIRTTGISVDETFRNPLLRYDDETDYIYCDLQSIYFKYVSNGSTYGSDLTRWPKSVSDYAACELAARVAPSITQNFGLQDKLEKISQKLLKKARSRDALNQPTRSLPLSSWLRSRGGNYGSSERGGRL